jgi:hypothetical protein
MNICSVCGKETVSPNRLGTGYGITPNGDKVCYECCAKQDMAYMESHDKITLYHSCREKEEVINWPGTLRFPAFSFEGKHNWGLPRYDVYFVDHTGQRWHGVRIGDNTDLVHCQKIKKANYFAESLMARKGWVE